MKKVVSFCLYGYVDYYRKGALRNLELCKIHYPDWEVWMYVSPSIPKEVITSLKDAGAKIHIIEDEDTPFFMNYRYFPASDASVDYAIFRDTDSRVDEREAAAVNEWINSGKGLHIMRDHPWHGPAKLHHMMMGGMWGVKCDKLRDAKDIILTNKITCNHGYDQYLITKFFYPRFAEDYIAHDEFFEKTKWPLPRVKRFIQGYNREMYLFTGCSYDWDDQPNYPIHVGIVEDYLKQNNLLPE